VPAETEKTQQSKDFRSTMKKKLAGEDGRSKHLKEKAHGSPKDKNRVLTTKTSNNQRQPSPES